MMFTWKVKAIFHYTDTFPRTIMFVVSLVLLLTVCRDTTAEKSTDMVFRFALQPDPANKVWAAADLFRREVEKRYCGVRDSITFWPSNHIVGLVFPWKEGQSECLSGLRPLSYSPARTPAKFRKLQNQIHHSGWYQHKTSRPCSRQHRYIYGISFDQFYFLVLSPVNLGDIP